MSENLIVLGTGNAQASRCYNTCFAIHGEQGLLLCDAGGGSGILHQLEEANIAWTEIHDLIITHAHSDHLLGCVWAVRMIATLMNKGKYEGQLRIYCDPDVWTGLCAICRITLQKKMCDQLEKNILHVPVFNGFRTEICGWPVTFFDILSTKMKQFGFHLTLQDGQKLCCLGDEPYNPKCKSFVENASWLLCEAFCLYGDRERFQPYEKHHSTVKEACELAQDLQIPHLVLWHTEDKHIENRKELYIGEGRQYYHGELYVPDDLDRIEL